MVLPSTCILRVANSTPMVDFDSKLNSFLVNRDRRLLFPTPESPIRTTEKRGETKTINDENDARHLDIKTNVMIEKHKKNNIIVCMIYERQKTKYNYIKMYVYVLGFLFYILQYISRTCSVIFVLKY